MNLGQEDEYQEFKEGLSQLDKGLKSLSAMLNKNNEGTVYFGVKDNGEVIGLQIGKDTLEDIRNRIRDKIDPRVYASISVEKSQNLKEYIKVYARGDEIPYCFDGRYYIRNVSSDEQLTNNMLRKMLASSSADLLRQKISPVQELTFKAFYALLMGCGIHISNSNEFLNNYGLLNNEDKYNMNAYLLSDNNNISIKVVEFAGKDKTVMSKRTEYGKKCLLLTIDEVLRFFESINTTSVDLSGSIRKEIPLFDFASFKEAWINACLHNDWRLELGPSIYLYDDRIEIESYGGLPYSLSKEKFFMGTSMPVNKSLLTIFMAAKYAEQSGHGVPTIVKKYGEEIFDFSSDMLKVSIPLSYERLDVAYRKNKEMLTNSLSKNQQKVLEILKENNKVGYQQLADLTNISLVGVKKICKRLQELNIIEKVGTRKEYYWFIK